MATFNKKPTENKARDTWNTIKGVAHVHVKTFSNGDTSVTLNIGHKNKAGTWDNFYLPVIFAEKCNITLEEGLNKIYIFNSFLSCYAAKPDGAKDATIKLRLVITDADVMTGDEIPEKK